MRARWRYRRIFTLSLLLAALPAAGGCSGCTDTDVRDAGWSIDSAGLDSSADADTEPSDTAEPSDIRPSDVDVGPDSHPDSEVESNPGDTDAASDGDDKTFWDDIGDSCPPDKEVFPRETVALSSSAPMQTDPLKLRWTQKDICPMTAPDGELKPDLGISLGSSVPGGDGDTIYAQVGKQPYLEVPGRALAVSMLDASSGRVVRCPHLSAPVGARATDVVTTVGSPERVFDATMGSSSPHFALHALSSTGSTLFQRRETDESMRGQAGPLVVKGDGQLVLLWNHQRIVSFDGTSGRANWALGPRDVPELRKQIEESGETCSGLNPRCMPEPKDRGRFYDLQLLPGGELVASAEVDGEKELVVIDRCGTGSIWSAPPADAQVMKVDGTYIFQTGDELELYERTQSGPTSRISNCDAVATPASDRIACRGSAADEIREYDLTGSLLQTRKLPTLPGTLSYGPMTAARGGYILLATGSKSGPPFARVVELPDSGSPRHYEQVKPNQYATTGSTRPPLVANDGTIVFNSWARLYAVDGNFPGLAPGPYPRGPRLGGNRNQGYVQVTSDSNP